MFKKLNEEKILKVAFLFLLISNCSYADGVRDGDMYGEILLKQLKMLSPELIAELESEKVKIIGDPLFVDVITIDGLKISNVIISDKLIPDPKKRYFIAHLVRNVLIQGAKIYNYDEQGNDLVMYPVIEISDDFIFENKKIICDVIYYLLHKDYFNLCGNQGTNGEKLFTSSLLIVINEEINNLKTRLMEENALILNSTTVTGAM